ncbi:hypothetical protein AQJ11_44450 [Streptomyces corchorusii]|uniref:Uncharacterized protein n=2 Tax=Streptomyces TaxID=1883 RepID=A0A101PN48_STRCK|nr:hypothetical protein [Streptomyces corchorusii]KUN14575.1 hypothetical protein AQJ11_44450 [Streptomyces corchorusii]
MAVGLPKWRVIVASDSRAAEDLHGDLSRDGSWDSDISVELEQSASRFRTGDAAILVATIAAASSALTALVTGILGRGAAKAGQRIVIELASGARLEVPAGVEPAELDRMLSLIREDPQRILLP